VRAIRTLDEGQACSQEPNPSSRQRGCYVGTMTARVHCENNSGHEPQAAWRQEELIGANHQS
jgi:hypothetical protein